MELWQTVANDTAVWHPKEKKQCVMGHIFVTMVALCDLSDLLVNTFLECAKVVKAILMFGGA